MAQISSLFGCEKYENTGSSVGFIVKYIESFQVRIV